ncbi:hypothetical protein A2U01_0007843, partial [Trifolium medium]|nr:hypothetical protein [Trifolium medium]
MVVTLSNLVTSLLCSILSAMINIMWRVIGKKYGKRVLRTKRVIFYGDYVGDVFQRVLQAAGLSSVMVSAACQQGRVATLFSSIWHNRNDKIWNDNARRPSQVGQAAFDHWNEWFVVHKMRSNDDHDVQHLSINR